MAMRSNSCFDVMVRFSTQNRPKPFQNRWCPKPKPVLKICEMSKPPVLKPVLGTGFNP